MAFPVTELTQEEYDNLPIRKSVSFEDSQKMDIGFRFKFNESTSGCPTCQEVRTSRIMCEVVNFLDAIEDQVGGGMLGHGAKFINRYQVKIVPKPAA